MIALRISGEAGGGITEDSPKYLCGILGCFIDSENYMSFFGMNDDRNDLMKVMNDWGI